MLAYPVTPVEFFLVLRMVLQSTFDLPLNWLGLVIPYLVFLDDKKLLVFFHTIVIVQTILLLDRPWS